MEISIPTQNNTVFQFEGSLLLSKKIPLFGLNRVGDVDFFEVAPEKYPALLPSSKYLLALETLPGAFEIQTFCDAESVARYFDEVRYDPDHVLKIAGERIFSSVVHQDSAIKAAYRAYRSQKVPKSRDWVTVGQSHRN